MVAFWDRAARAQRAIGSTNQAANRLQTKVSDLKRALAQTRSAPTALDDQWQAIQSELHDITETLRGNQSMAEVGQDTPASIQSRLGKVLTGVGQSTYGPTRTHEQQLEFAERDFETLRIRINTLQETTIPAFEKALLDANGPWTPGGTIPPL